MHPRHLQSTQPLSGAQPQISKYAGCLFTPCSIHYQPTHFGQVLAKVKEGRDAEEVPDSQMVNTIAQSLEGLQAQHQEVG